MNEDPRDAWIAQAAVIAATPGLDEDWFYLSFVGRGGFLGGCYLRAPTMEAAVPRAHMLQINPGGEVKLAGPLPQALMDENVPAEQRERLLTRAEVESQ